MSEIFESLKPEIDSLSDKDGPLLMIYKGLWPLVENSKPTWYYENGDKKIDKEVRKSIKLNSEISQYLKTFIDSSAKEIFNSLRIDIENVLDKTQSIIDVKSRKWPLDIEKKPLWYHEGTDIIDDKWLISTMSLNHYIKSYLERLIIL